MIGIVISILGLVVVIVSTYLVYKTAKDNGRRAALWAVFTCIAGLALQFIIPTIATMIMVLVFMASSPAKTPYLQQQAMEDLNWYAFMFSIGGLVLSFVAIWAIMRFVLRLPEESTAPVVPPPPPPSNFDPQT